MKVVLKIPRLVARPLGEQICIQNVVKVLFQVAPPDWQFVIMSAGVRRMAGHFRRIALLDPHSRASIQHLPIPESLLSVSIRAVNLPSASQMFGSAEIVHSLACQWIPSGTKGLILTMLDVIPFRWLEDRENLIAKDRMQRLLKYIVGDVKAILTISEFSRQEIVDVFQLDPNLISVIPVGVDHGCFRAIEEIEIQPAYRTLQRLGIKIPYILYAGGQTARKNLARLVRAYDLTKHSKELDHQLVIVGDSQLAPDVAAEVMASRFRDSIVVTGYLPKADMLRLIQLSDMLVFPSLYEGFGMPPLEAMACGVPVAVSKAASLPEVCADAALYFDPQSEEEIAASMYKLASDRELRSRCIANGIVQARGFSWEKHAEKTLAIYRSIGE